MSETLVAYFSATGVTARAAKRLARDIGAEGFEILPKKPYTDEDLSWNNPKSRCIRERMNSAVRPGIAGECINLDSFDTIYVGFPIWWYMAPRIINTFLESYDFTGKRIIPFVTSAGLSVKKAKYDLQKSCPGAIVEEARYLATDISFRELSCCF